ncbi:MAG: hypothetical protein AAGG01_16185 [Planctomycetota bacterium]
MQRMIVPGGAAHDLDLRAGGLERARDPPDEAEISRATFELIVHERLMVEGAVGVALAAWQRDRGEDRAGGRSCVIVCGGNLDEAHLRAVLANHGPA